MTLRMGGGVFELKVLMRQVSVGGGTMAFVALAVALPSVLLMEIPNFFSKNELPFSMGMS